MPPELRMQTLRKADRIHRFPAKMSPRLAYSFLMESKRGDPSRNIRFHDPMCGSGTTALVARSLGLSVSAADAMYPASIIALAKLRRLENVKLTDMLEFARTVTISSKSSPSNKWANWRIWFTPKVLSSLEEIAGQINEAGNQSFFPHLLTAFFQTVWDTSSADRNVIVPTRSNNSRAAPKLRGTKVLAIFEQRLRRVSGAQRALGSLGFDTKKPPVYQANSLDSRSWPSGRVDLILTSPPYGCGIDYERAFRLQMRIWSPFLKRQPTRLGLVGRRNNLDDPEISLSHEITESSWYRRTSNGDPTRWQMFLQYLSDFKRFLHISRQRLSKTGRLCLVIGNPQINKTRVPLVDLVEGLAWEEHFRLEASPSQDRIKTRVQNFRLRSATSHIQRDYLLSFLPS